MRHFSTAFLTRIFLPLPLRRGLVHMGSGMTTGFAGLAAGVCVGTVGDAAVRAYAFQTKVFVGMVLILIFAEVLGMMASVL